MRVPRRTTCSKCSAPRRICSSCAHKISAQRPRGGDGARQHAAPRAATAAMLRLLALLALLRAAEAGITLEFGTKKTATIKRRPSRRKRKKNHRRRRRHLSCPGLAHEEGARKRATVGTGSDASTRVVFRAESLSTTSLVVHLLLRGRTVPEGAGSRESGRGEV